MVILMNELAILIYGKVMLGLFNVKGWTAPMMQLLSTNIKNGSSEY